MLKIDRAKLQEFREENRKAECQSDGHRPYTGIGSYQSPIPRFMVCECGHVKRIPSANGKTDE